jgi:hypothetical protein
METICARRSEVCITIFLEMSSPQQFYNYLIFKHLDKKIGSLLILRKFRFYSKPAPIYAGRLDSLRYNFSEDSKKRLETQSYCNFSNLHSK